MCACSRCCCCDCYAHVFNRSSVDSVFNRHLGIVVTCLPSPHSSLPASPPLSISLCRRRCLTLICSITRNLQVLRGSLSLCCCLCLCLCLCCRCLPCWECACVCECVSVFVCLYCAACVTVSLSVCLFVYIAFRFASLIRLIHSCFCTFCACFDFLIFLP